MNNFSEILEDLDEDLLLDFLDTVYYEQGRIEQIFMVLHKHDYLEEDFRAVLASIENIKSFCTQTLMDPMIRYADVLADLVRYVTYICSQYIIFIWEANNERTLEYVIKAISIMSCPAPSY